MRVAGDDIVVGVIIFKRFYYCSSYNDDAVYTKISFLVTASKIHVQVTPSGEEQTSGPLGDRPQITIRPARAP